MGENGYQKGRKAMSEIESSGEGNEMRGDRRVLRMKALCIGALGGVLLLAACAKQPGVTAIQPPPQAAGAPGARGEVVTPPPVPLRAGCPRLASPRPCRGEWRSTDCECCRRRSGPPSR